MSGLFSGPPVRQIASVSFCFCLFALGSIADAATTRVETVRSPDGQISVEVFSGDRGVPSYRVRYGEEVIIDTSPLGLRFARHGGLDAGFTLDAATSAGADTTWEQPWGERRFVRDHHNELLVTFSAPGQDSPEKAKPRAFDVRFRVFDEGVGFRYEVPKNPGPRDVVITDERTGFRLPDNATAWWIPSRQWNRYEYLYAETPIGGVTTAHTPMTVRTPGGTFVSIHEAALVDYSAMSLRQNRPGEFKADLSPWPTGGLVRLQGAFKTPWRTIQIAPTAAGLINGSDLILNLNEPNKLGDVSWVEPGKYVGIWWAMHMRDRTWGRDGYHGATTEETRRYIDFAAEHGFKGVLVEGWNIGWDGDWFHNGALFRFTEPYPDFDLLALGAYAVSKGVRLIGHHETSANISNYEVQMGAAFDLYAKAGVRQVKTGYVADGGGFAWLEDGIMQYGWHDSQRAVRHHLKVVEEAAKRQISINPHEPIKDTGLRRTYPNWIAREGARGMEYDAWGIPPNPPAHTAILPFTRMLSGPMDFTPGIFELRPNELPPVRADLPRNSPLSRVESTLAKQLALYVVIYSPIQMAADLPEHYLKRPDAFQFIKDVPTDWENSVALDGAIGDFVVIARQGRGTEDWFVGGLTDEQARMASIDLGFLPANTAFRATIYRDGAGADFDRNPYPIIIEQRDVAAATTLRVPMAPGGGFAIRLSPVRAANTMP